MPAHAPAVRPPAHAAPSSRPGAHAPARPQLRVVETPRRRRQLRTGPTFALGAVLAFLIAFGVVVSQAVLVQGQQRLDELDAQIAEETDRYQALRLELAELESPARIIDAATALGMVPPPEVVYLTPNGAVSLGTADSSSPVGLDAPADQLAEHAATRPNLDGGG
jgi:cell division protein FtsL